MNTERHRFTQHYVASSHNVCWRVRTPIHSSLSCLCSCVWVCLCWVNVDRWIAAAAATISCACVWYKVLDFVSPPFVFAWFPHGMFLTFGIILGIHANDITPATERMSRWQMYFFRCWVANSFTKYFSRLVPTSRPVVHIMCFTYTCTGTQQLLCRHFESLLRRTHTHTLRGLYNDFGACKYVSVSRQRAFSLHLFRYDSVYWRHASLPTAWLLLGTLRFVLCIALALDFCLCTFHQLYSSQGTAVQQDSTVSNWTVK